MSGENWTPGPWVIDPEENWIVTEWRSTEHGLQYLICDMMDEESPTYAANAHLIAAAPELYEALNKCRAFIADQYADPEGTEYVSKELRDVWRAINDALAKALGGEA